MGEEVQVFRLREAAEYVGVSRQTLNEAANRGEVPFDDLLGGRAFYSDELDAWAESRRKAKVAA
jgi:excisionase family DNA binding protein